MSCAEVLPLKSDGLQLYPHSETLRELQSAADKNVFPVLEDYHKFLDKNFEPVQAVDPNKGQAIPTLGIRRPAAQGKVNISTQSFGAANTVAPPTVTPVAGSNNPRLLTIQGTVNLTIRTTPAQAFLAPLNLSLEKISIILSFNDALDDLINRTRDSVHKGSELWRVTPTVVKQLETFNNLLAALYTIFVAGLIFLEPSKCNSETPLIKQMRKLFGELTDTAAKTKNRVENWIKVTVTELVAPIYQTPWGPGFWNHIVTCRTGLGDEFANYIKGIQQDDELWGHQDFLYWTDRYLEMKYENRDENKDGELYGEGPEWADNLAKIFGFENHPKLKQFTSVWTELFATEADRHVYKHQSPLYWVKSYVHTIHESRLFSSMVPYFVVGGRESKEFIPWPDVGQINSGQASTVAHGKNSHGVLKPQEIRYVNVRYKTWEEKREDILESINVNTGKKNAVDEVFYHGTSQSLALVVKESIDITNGKQFQDFSDGAGFYLWRSIDDAFLHAEKKFGNDVAVLVYVVPSDFRKHYNGQSFGLARQTDVKLNSDNETEKWKACVRYFRSGKRKGRSQLKAVYGKSCHFIEGGLATSTDGFVTSIELVKQNSQICIKSQHLAQFFDKSLRYVIFRSS